MTTVVPNVGAEYPAGAAVQATPFVAVEDAVKKNPSVPTPSLATVAEAEATSKSPLVVTVDFAIAAFAVACAVDAFATAVVAVACAVEAAIFAVLAKSYAVFTEFGVAAVEVLAELMLSVS